MHSKQTIELTVPLHAELGLTRNDLDNLAIEASALAHPGARALMLELLDARGGQDECGAEREDLGASYNAFKEQVSEARDYLDGAAHALETAEYDFRRVFGRVVDALVKDNDALRSEFEEAYEKLQWKVETTCEAIWNAEGAL